MQYFVKVLVISVFQLVIGSHQSTWTCPSGWELHGLQCYKMSHQVSNFSNAQKYCHHQRAEIIMPKTEEENYVTKMLLQKVKFSTSSEWNGLWIGLTDNEHEGTWNWNDGTKPDFLYWTPGEPNGYSGENCAIIDESRRKWHDVQCSISDWYSAVCQLKATEEMCSCRCDYKRKLEHWESKIPQHQTMEDLKRELEPVIRKIQNELKVNKTNLSSTIRKLTSAKDERKSSHAIGFFGALFISVIFGTVFFMDIVMLRQQIDNIRKICGNKEKNIRQNLSRKKKLATIITIQKKKTKIDSF